MNRDDVLLTQKFTKVHLGTLLDNYGIVLLAKMIPSVYKFNYQINRLNSRNWNNGRPQHHLNKSTGKLSKKFKGTNLRKCLVIDFSRIKKCESNLKLMQSVKCIQRHIRKIYIKRYNAAVCIQKYMRKFYVKICKENAILMIEKGVDFMNDIITTEPLINPCIILPDFYQGNCVFYNESTIQKFVKTQKIAIFTYFNAYVDEEEIFYRHVMERDVLGNVLYKSPFTRADFIMDDVILLKNNILFKFGKYISSN